MSLSASLTRQGLNDSMSGHAVVARGLGLYGFSWLWAVLNNTGRDMMLIVVAFITFRYAWTVFSYRRNRHKCQESDQMGLLPPTYPSLLPFMGNIIPLALSTELFFRVATSYRGSLTSTRIPVLGSVFYMFQDRGTVKELMRQRDRLTPIDIRLILPSKNLFGMPETKGLDAYRADNSGPHGKPHSASTVSANDRVDFLHRHTFHRELMGPGLAPTRVRIHKALRTRLDALCSGSEWSQVDDLFNLLGKIVSKAITEAIFGPTLLQLNPDFIDSLWAFDTAVPWLARGVPRWVNPGPHRARDKLHSQIKKWHAYAREKFHHDSIGPDGNGDPYWGSEMIRHFHKSLAETGKHSDDAMASHDLGLIWGVTSNAASAAALAAFHVFSDRELLSRVSSELATRLPEHSSPAAFDSLPTHVLSGPALFPSIFAETLRLYASGSLVMASPPDRDVSLKKWIFPRRSFGVVSPALVHRDESYWNTKDGQHPVDTFRADRFLVYPDDPTSGPVRPDVQSSKGAYVEPSANGNGCNKPRFSTEGLDHSFIPFGAGSGKCPGRLIAKDVALATCARLVGAYDIDISTKHLDTNPWIFGLAVRRPNEPIRARIRRKS